MREQRHPRQATRVDAALGVMSVAIYPGMLVFFAGLYIYDTHSYLHLLREDGPVENVTALTLVLIAVVCLFIARRARRREGRYPWFYLTLGILSVVAALEEISWGQRILGFRSPEFFLQHARQEETNLHNVFQKWTTLKVKDIAPVVFVLYGLILPIAKARSAGVRSWLETHGVAVPPIILSTGFLLGSVLMLDRPTKREEEIGELFVSLCVLQFVLLEHLKAADRRTAPAGAGHST